ncbi:MAG: helix-turn-helix domain-containing protein [Eubacterium sp.]|nr:helix-turn-helix domain-containing protein [Eubacterium sp.]
MNDNLISGVLHSKGFGSNGSPIYKYIKKVKVNKAAELLKIDSNLKISDVAESVGYDNPSKFAAAFKDVMGLTPLEYKQKK